MPTLKAGKYEGKVCKTLSDGQVEDVLNFLSNYDSNQLAEIAGVAASESLMQELVTGQGAKDREELTDAELQECSSLWTHTEAMINGVIAQATE